MRTLAWQSPYLEGKCIDNCHTEWENLAIFGRNRYLVPFNRGIATTSVRTGLAMTGYLEAERQTPIYRTKGLPGVFGEALRGFICFPAGFPCARIGSQEAWDPPLPREPAFFPLPSWRFTPDSVFPG